MHPLFPAAPPEPPGGPARQRALERAADLAVLAPSVHDTRPWRLVPRPDRLVVRADRARTLTTVDPSGRELVQSVGAALFTARVALAAEGWGAEVDRLPDPADPDLLAVVRPVPGLPDPGLAALVPAVARRRADRPACSPDEVPGETLRDLTAAAAAEGVRLVPVLDEAHRRLVARLVQQADRLQHIERRRPETGSAADRTLVLLATHGDDALAWLRSGEAMQRVLLELAVLGWSAGPFSPVVEVPLTRTQLRSALTWDAHPQLLLRVGRAEATPSAPPRPGAGVVLGSAR